VPPAWKLLASVAESVTELPTLITVFDRLVVIVGLVTLILITSHELVAGLLLVSPLYTAIQLIGTTEVNVCEAEFGTTPFATLTVETTMEAPAQTSDAVKRV
jgi:hypothetical protein